MPSAQVARRKDDAPVVEMVWRRFEPLNRVFDRDERRQRLFVRVPEDAVPQISRQHFRLFP